MMVNPEPDPYLPEIELVCIPIIKADRKKCKRHLVIKAICYNRTR